MMKARVQLKPTLMPETTPSTLVGRRWAMAMLTQSDGVPSTIQVGQPKPRSTAADLTRRLRVLEAPVQLCSLAGATMYSSWPAALRAKISSCRKTELIPSSFVTRSFMGGARQGRRRGHAMKSAKRCDCGSRVGGALCPDFTLRARHVGA